MKKFVRLLRISTSILGIKMEKYEVFMSRKISDYFTERECNVGILQKD